jgi:hypothetical protein
MEGRKSDAEEQSSSGEREEGVRLRGEEPVTFGRPLPVPARDFKKLRPVPARARKFESRAARPDPRAATSG